MNDMNTPLLVPVSAQNTHTHTEHKMNTNTHTHTHTHTDKLDVEPTPKSLSLSHTHTIRPTSFNFSSFLYFLYRFVAGVVPLVDLIVVILG